MAVEIITPEKDQIISDDGLTIRFTRSGKYTLKPCPFCGHAAMICPWHSPTPKRSVLVGCNNGHCRLNPSLAASSVKRAVEEWNTRAEPDQEAW